MRAQDRERRGWSGSAAPAVEHHSAVARLALTFSDGPGALHRPDGEREEPLMAIRPRPWLWRKAISVYSLVASGLGCTPVAIREARWRFLPLNLCVLVAVGVILRMCAAGESVETHTQLFS